MDMVLLKYWMDLDTNTEEIPFLLVLTFRIPHQRIEDYYEGWIDRYLDEDFFRLFRMTRETFHKLLLSLNCNEKKYVGGEQPIPMEKALLMTIWWLGKGEVLLSVADRFNVAVSTVYNITEFMLEKVLSVKSQYIVWPDQRERPKLEFDFRQRSGYPGVIGAIDCCNIKFKPPTNQQDSYIDKNSNHSIKLQGIVASNKIFTNIMVGYPGSVHDSRVFKNSKLYFDVEENGHVQKYFDDNYHLVGDKAYPLRKWIMTPFKDNGRLTNYQRRYNTFHSITRIVVEHTFGILKGRWRILRSINCNSVEKTIRIIAACCVLHNFCYVNSDFWDNYEPVEDDNDVYQNGGDAPLVAVNKRNDIMNFLCE